MTTCQRTPPDKRPVRWLPAAETELEVAAAWYATKGGAAAALRWLTAFERGAD